MPSLNVDLNYFDHIKTMRLVARLGPGSDVLPIKLWAYVGKQQPAAGSVEMLAAELEHAIGWWGEKGAATAAMIEIGFVTHADGKWYVHDWFDHSGHLAAFKKRALKANRIRWSRYRKSSSPTRSPKQHIKESPSSTLPCSTLHNNTPLPPAGGLMRFDDFWKTYPKRIGRKAAERHWHASVKTAVDVTDIRSALVNYLRSDDVRRGFMQNGSTWMNNWRDWIGYKGVEMPSAPKPLPKPPEVLPPDPTAADLIEMHRQKVSTMGPCRKACEMCETKGIKNEV